QLPQAFKRGNSMAYDKYKCPDCNTPTPETMVGQGTQTPMGHCPKCKGGAKRLVKLSSNKQAMEVVQDNLWLCDDCLFAAVNGDYSGLDMYYNHEDAEKRMQEIQAGLKELGWLTPDFDSETGDGIDSFSSRHCDCCGSNLAGERHRFSVLGPDQDFEVGEQEAPVPPHIGSKVGKTMDAKGLANAVSKTARILCEEDLPNGNPELQKMVGDPDDFRTSTFAQFAPNPGNLLLPNPLSPIEGDEVFFAYMIPGAIFQAHDGSQWWILGYDYRGQVEIENRWYPRIHAQVSVYDVRRSIDQWIEPIQQTVPPPPPGVNYDAQPVMIVDHEDFS